MAFTVFLVTKDESASDVNGGGPNLTGDGAPEYACADATVAGGALTTIVDNTGSDWPGVEVDDWVCWDSAGVKEFRRITNIAGANATIHAAATAGANKSCNVGGPWATIDHAASTITTAFVNAAGDWPKVAIGLGTYGEQFQIDSGGSSTVPISYEGFETTPGDNCPAGTFPLISSAGVALAGGLTIAAGIDYLRIRCLKITMTGAGIEAINSASDYALFERLHLKATGANGSGLYSGGFGNVFRNIYVEEAPGTGIYAGNYSNVTGCTVRASVVGIRCNSYTTATLCTVEGSANCGFYLAGSHAGIINCTVYADSADDGVIVGNFGGCFVYNSILSENAAYGIDVGTNLQFHEDYNAFYNNGTAETDGVTIRGAHDVTLTHDPFVDKTNHDFTLNRHPGGGQLCREAGFPGQGVSGAPAGHLAAGALQPPAERDYGMWPSGWS